MNINFNDELDKAFYEGLQARLDKKEVKLGELKKKFHEDIIKIHEVEDEILTIKHTMKKCTVPQL